MWPGVSPGMVAVVNAAFLARVSWACAIAWPGNLRSLERAAAILPPVGFFQPQHRVLCFIFDAARAPIADTVAVRRSLFLQSYQQLRKH